MNSKRINRILLTFAIMLILVWVVPIVLHTIGMHFELISWNYVIPIWVLMNLIAAIVGFAFSIYFARHKQSYINTLLISCWYLIFPLLVVFVIIGALH